MPPLPAEAAEFPYECDLEGSVGWAWIPFPIISPNLWLLATRPLSASATCSSATEQPLALAESLISLAWRSRTGPRPAGHWCRGSPVRAAVGASSPLSMEGRLSLATHTVHALYAGVADAASVTLLARNAISETSRSIPACAEQPRTLRVPMPLP